MQKPTSARFAGPRGESPARPASSPALARPSGVTPKRGTPSARAAPPSRPEVVASIDDDDKDSSQVRRITAAPPAPRGLSLRWKIVVGMAAITITTGILISLVVYPKAVRQLDVTIDEKGVRLVRTLATIDGGYWMYAIYQTKEDRQEKLDMLLSRLFSSYLSDNKKREVLQANPDMRRMYDLVIMPLGSEKRDSAGLLLSRLLETVLADAQNEAHRQKVRDYYENELRNPKWQAEFQKLVDPFGGMLKPLKGDRKDVGPGFDILQISVLDISQQEGRSVQAVDSKGEQRLTIDPGSKRKDPLGVEISDGVDKTSGRKVRLFAMDQDTGVGRLRYNVLLSLEHIEDAQGSLAIAIFLPVLVSVFLGIGIAIWISTLITEPIKILMRDINEVSGGNLDHQTLAVSKDEVGQLAMTFNRMTTALRMAHEQEIEAKAMEHDLSVASEIQSNLVPKRMLKIPGYDISAYYRPSKEVGGDYYDFITIDEENEGIIVADVSGKGLPGALVMSMARAFIRMEAERSRNVSPSDTLLRANRMLAQDIKKGMFVTAMYCILNRRTNEIRVSSAGHNPLVVWRAATNQIELVNPAGIALGFDKGPVFERTVKEEKLILNHGDRIVAYTDGTVEAMDPANQEFGDKRFFSLIQQLATRDSNQMLNLVIKTLDEHKSAAPQHDDITIVTMRYL